MSHTERLRRSPNAFSQLTGNTPAAFDRLLADLTPRHQQAAARRKDRPGRRRRPGAGRKHALDLADRLPMLRVLAATVQNGSLRRRVGKLGSERCRSLGGARRIRGQRQSLSPMVGNRVPGYLAAVFCQCVRSASMVSRAMKPTRSFSSIVEHQAITSAAGKSHFLSASMITLKPSSMSSAISASSLIST